MHSQISSVLLKKLLENKSAPEFVIENLRRGDDTMTFTPKEETKLLQK